MLKLGSVIAVAMLGLVGCAEDDPVLTQAPEETSPPAAAAGTVEVTAVEYEFQGIPEELTPGPYSFRLENVGDEPHEFAIVRIKSDASLEELIQLPEKESQAQIEEVGFAFAKPGDSDALEAELEQGRYGYACFVEAPNGKPHSALGMSGELTVA